MISNSTSFLHQFLYYNSSELLQIGDYYYDKTNGRLRCNNNGENNYSSSDSIGALLGSRLMESIRDAKILLVSP